MTAKIKVVKEAPSYLQWSMAVLANSALLTYGLQLGWVSPMTKVLQSDGSPTGRPLSDNEISFVASTLCLFAIFGVPLYAFISDTFGRKVGLIALAVPQALSWMIKLSSANTAVLISARALTGLAGGGCFNVVPMYVREISHDSVRGMLGSMFIIAQNIGLLGMFALGAFFDYFTVLYIVMGIPIVTLPLILWKAPESPAYLIKLGKIEKAEETVAYLRRLDVSDKRVQSEIECMKKQDEYFKSLPSVSFFAVFKKKAWRRGFILVALLMTCQAFNGNMIVMMHAAAILAISGVTVSPELQSMSFPVVMILASIVSMNCVDRFGRKPILIAAFALVSASMAAVGTIVLLQQQGIIVPAWLSVISLLGVVAGHAGACSPVPYIIMSELFNFQIRAKFMGCIVTYAWFMAFAQMNIFTPMSEAFGRHSVFYFFCVINFLGIFATLLLPETKGKNIHQIEAELVGK